MQHGKQFKKKTLRGRVQVWDRGRQNRLQETIASIFYSVFEGQNLLIPSPAEALAFIPLRFLVVEDRCQHVDKRESRVQFRRKAITPYSLTGQGNREWWFSTLSVSHLVLAGHHTYLFVFSRQYISAEETSNRAELRQQLLFKKIRKKLFTYTLSFVVHLAVRHWQYTNI